MNPRDSSVVSRRNTVLFGKLTRRLSSPTPSPGSSAEKDSKISMARSTDWTDGLRLVGMEIHFVPQGGTAFCIIAQAE
jgi:hypothetical protein